VETYAHQTDATLAARSRWVMVTEAVIVGLLAFSPLAFGVVEAWSELVVVLAAAALSMGLAARAVFDRRFEFIGTWAYLPLGLFIALVVFQSIPLPASWIRALSPGTLATKSRLLSGGEPAWTPLSFYRLATLHDLRMVLLGTVVFTATVLTFRTPEQIKRLLRTVFLIGLAIAVLAMLQISTFATQIYWFAGGEGGSVTAGPFVNHSNFSQFMNLSIGAGLGLLLVKLRHEDKRRRPWQWGGTFRPRVLGWFLTGLVLCAAAVFTSGSRNGVLSLTIAATLVGTGLFCRRVLKGREWLLAVLPWGVLALLLLTGFDAVFERLASLKEEHDWNFRWEMTAATLRSWLEFPIWGAGLGTHEYVFPMFDRAKSTSIAVHADNDYAQLLEEMGLIGGVLVGLFLAVIIRDCAWLMLRGRTSLAMAAFGLGYGLLSVAIHSASDFGQRLPAIFFLSAVTCGLIVNIAHFERGRTGKARPLRRVPRSAFAVNRSRQVIAVFSAALLALLWSWAIPSAYASYMGERHWHDALILESRLAQQNWQGSDAEYVALISSAAAAEASEPLNVKYGYWLNLYRWYSISRVMDAETGEVLLHPDAFKIVERIADELSRIRGICPSYGPPYAVEGQLRLFVLGEESGADLIQKAYQLASYDPTTCLVAGRLAAERGEEEAASMLKRAVELQSSYFDEVVRILLFELGNAALAEDLAGDDYSRLERLVQLCAGSDQYAGLADDLKRRAEESLRKRVSSGEATVRELSKLADIEVEIGDLDSAAALYRQALQSDYGNIGLRLALARLLAKLGRNDEALREARICLRIRPDTAVAQELISELSAF
jgi:O-antigen ligase/tetratricopeptide (TPR) repeat protein